MLPILLILILVFLILIGYILYQSHVLRQQHHRKMETLHAVQIDLIGTIQKQLEKNFLQTEFKNRYLTQFENLKSEIVLLQNVLLKSVTNQNNS